MADWYEGAKCAYGLMEGIPIPVSTVDPIWDETAQAQEFSYNPVQGRWSGNSLYLLPSGSSYTSNWEPLVYYPIQNSSGNTTGYIGMHYKSYLNQRNEWMGEFSYRILGENKTTLHTYREWQVGGFNPAFHDGIYFTFGVTQKSGHLFYWFASCDIRKDGEGNLTSSAFGWWLRDDFAALAALGQPQIKKIKESPEFGPASEPEGYEPDGGYDDRCDQIGLPPKPQSILALGFVNVYKCDAGSLSQFGDALFPEIQFPQSLSDVGEVLAAVSDSIWNSKLIDYVISVHCVPGDVPAGNLEDIKVGTRRMTGILARPITNEYVDFDFDSISVDPYFKNYADYMTEVQLYLPMYGFISLKPEEIIGGSIKVVYRFNVIDGSFQAFVFATSNRSPLAESMIGQYGGSCVVHLPVSNLSYSSMFSSMIGGATSMAVGAATGGAGMVAGALATTGAMTQAIQGGDSKKSNSYNASASFMARMQPYVIITRPCPSFSTLYNDENGLPSNVAMTLGSCVGFTIAENAILDGIPCTSDEKERIRNYLKSGVIIR